MRTNSNQDSDALPEPEQNVSPQTYTDAEKAVTNVATLLASFAVAVSALNRISDINSGIANAHNLFFASFLKGLSNGNDTVGAEPDLTDKLADVREEAAKESFLQRTAKDFQEARKMQAVKFDKGMEALGNPSTDKSESFLRLPKKEMLAFDRSARAFLMNVGGEETKALLSRIDEIGHNYSAAKGS